MKVLFIALLVIFISTTVGFAEGDDGPTFRLPEETIMGIGKDKPGAEGKEEIRAEEKYGRQELSAEKVTPELLIKERDERAVKAQKKRSSQIDLDFSFGSYDNMNFKLDYSKNLGRMRLDKRRGNKARPDSEFDYNAFDGQLFAGKVNFTFKVNSNKFDVIAGTRVCNNYKFGFDIKPREKLFFALRGEDTSLKEQASQRNQSFGLKILLNFKWTCEIEEDRLKDRYSRTFYSFGLDGQPIAGRAKIGAGLSKEDGEKIRLDPDLAIFYRYSPAANLEAGLNRQSKKAEFYDLYGENDFAQLNFSPLKRMDCWQIYSKAFLRFNNDALLNVKIFHDWIKNFVVFDEDEANPDRLWIPINLGDAQRDGIRVSCFKKMLPNISTEIGYEYLDQTVPLQSDGFDVALKYDGQLFQLSMDCKYKGERYYDKDSDEKLDGYFLLGYLVEKPVSDKLTFYTEGSNILGKEYEIIKGYQADRAKFVVGCKCNF